MIISKEDDEKDLMETKKSGLVCPLCKKWGPFYTTDADENEKCWKYRKFQYKGIQYMNCTKTFWDCYHKGLNFEKWNKKHVHDKCFFKCPNCRTERTKEEIEILK